MTSWMRYVAGGLVVVALILLFALPVLAARYAENEAALAWLRQSREPDGGFPTGFAAGSDFGTTAEVILAVAAAGQDVSTWDSAEGLSPLDYVASQVASGQVSDVGNLSKAVLVAVATGQNPRDFGGVDLINQLLAQQDSTTGMFGDTLFKHAYAVLALRNAGAGVPASAVTAMTSQFTEDGAWALFGGTTPGTADTNTTALVMQALVAVGRPDAAAGALPYLRRMQNEDGGFPYQKPSAWGTETDANSTAVVLQALYALDEPLGQWVASGTDPLGALLALWDEESGAYLWQASTPFPNMLATAQAVQAGEGMTLVDVATVGASRAPQTEGAPTSTAPLLPASGGIAGSLVLVGAGLALLGTGGLLRRRS
ncbi:MAG: prenyltransferase/squalene oxidase repeat-containing protein [Anaerolineae bacterium]